jgi:CubicO group peptidase (beta-lactamase class C family)
LTQWLPEVKGNIPEARKITIRMLLNHTSGIFDPKNDDSTYIKKIEKEPDYIGKHGYKKPFEKLCL